MVTGVQTCALPILKVNRISIQSPVGKALIGKRVGDFVEVKTPVKMVEYEVLEIKFEEL